MTNEQNGSGSRVSLSQDGSSSGATHNPRPDMPELKPCPFCGGDGVHYQPNEDIAVISCTKCNAESGYYDFPDSTTPDDAIGFWNKRTRTPDPQVLVECLNDAIRQLNEYSLAEGKEEYNNPKFNEALAQFKGEKS